MDYEKSYLTLVRSELESYGGKAGIAFEENAARADIIVLLQSAQWKGPDYIKLLENDRLIRSHAERVFVIDYDDHPEGMLPGLYTSIEVPFWNHSMHKSWPILLANNPRIYNLTDKEIYAQSPARLFSFVGADSNPVRKRLFELFSGAVSGHQVEQVTKWYNHTEEDRQRYISITLGSAFCLCPRGYTSYTNRIPEVMAMGRVPVVIADGWIPFSLEEELPYYIKVAERDVESLPEILGARRRDAAELGRNARMLWRKYCSLERRVVAAIGCLRQLATETDGRIKFADLCELWHSREFQERAGWTRRQQIALRAEQHFRRWFPAAKLPGVSDLMRYRNRRP